MINGQYTHAVRRPGNSSPAGTNGNMKAGSASRPNGRAGPDADSVRVAGDDGPAARAADAARRQAMATRPSGDAPGTSDPDPTIEVEYEGRIYQVPAALRGAFLRQADYTRKTQGLARQRRALDRARQSLAMELNAQQAHIRDVAALVNLDEQLKPFAGMNWAALRQQNPAGANAAFQRMLHLTQTRNQVAARLQEKICAHSALRQQFGAPGTPGGQRLRPGDKGWPGRMAKRLRDYGLSLGFEPDELDAVTDPRVIKALERAYVAEKKVANGADPKATTRPASPELRPLSQVARRSSPAEIELSDRMTTEDWIKARNAQIRQRKGLH